MYGPGRFIRLLFVGALLFLLFGAFRGGAYRAGFSQGYQAGQSDTLAGQRVDGETAVPVTPRQPRPGAEYGGWGYAGPMSVVGGVFKFFFVLLLIGFVFKMLMIGHWHHQHGRSHGWKGHHNHPWHKHHGKWNPPREKKPEDVEPDIRTV